ncbi:MAG: beta strand repeat-containing protein [Halorhodospira sp.]
MIDPEGSTLHSDDYIDGGEGDDTLSVTLNTSFGGFDDEDAGVENVETVSLTNDTDKDNYFDASNVEGVNRYDLDAGEGEIGLRSLAESGITVSTNQGTGTLDLRFDDEAVEEETNELDLELNGVGKAGEDGDNDEYLDADVTAGASGITDLGLNAAGEQTNFVELANAEDVETVEADGEGDLDIGNVGSGVTTVNAGELQGDLTADLTASSGLEAVTAGEGADTVRIDAATFDSEDGELAGGQGEDELNLVNAEGDFSPNEMTGFESLSVESTSGNLDIDPEEGNVEGLEAVTLGSGLDDVRIRELGTESFNLTTEGDGGDARYDGAGDLGLSIDGGDTAAENEQAQAVDRHVKADEVDGRADIEIGGYAQYTNEVELGSAESVNLAVERNEDDGGDNVTAFSGGTLSADAASEVVVDADGLVSSGVIEADAAGTAEFNIADDLSSGSVSGSSDLDAVHTLDVDADSAFTFENTFENAREVNLSGELGTGSGAEWLNFASGFGDNTLDADLSVGASGIEGGDINLGNVAVGEDQAASLQAAGLESESFNFGNLTAEGEDGEVSADLTNAETNLFFGNMDASTVSLNAAGIEAASGNTVVGGASLIGDSVVMDVSSATGDVNLAGGITADESLTLQAQGLEGDLGVSGVSAEDEGEVVVNAADMEGQVGLGDVTVGDGTTGSIELNFDAVEGSGVTASGLDAATVDVSANAIESTLTLDGDVGGGSGDITLSFDNAEGAVAIASGDTITGETVTVTGENAESGIDLGGNGISAETLEMELSNDADDINVADGGTVRASEGMALDLTAAGGDIIVGSGGVDASSGEISIDATADNGVFRVADGGNLTADGTLTMDVTASGGVDIASGGVVSGSTVDITAESTGSGITIANGSGIVADDVTLDLTSADGTTVNGTVQTADLSLTLGGESGNTTIAGTESVSDSGSFLSGNDAGMVLDIDAADNSGGDNITLNGVYAEDGSEIDGGSGDILDIGAGGADLTNAELSGIDGFSGNDNPFQVAADQVNEIGWDNFVQAGSGEIVMDDGDSLTIQSSGAADGDEWAGAEIYGDDDPDNTTVAFEDTDGSDFDISALSRFEDIETVDLDGVDSLTMSVDHHDEMSEVENAGDATIALQYDGSGLETDEIDGVGGYLFDPQNGSNSLAFTMVDGGTDLGIMTDASDTAGVTIDLDGQTATGTWGSNAHTDAEDFRAGTDVLNASSGGDIAGVNDGSDIGGIDEVRFDGSDVTLTITADQFDVLTTGGATVSDAGSATIDFADAVTTGATIDNVGTWDLHDGASNEFALGTGGQEVYYGDQGDQVTVGEGNDVLRLGDGEDIVGLGVTTAADLGTNDVKDFETGSDVIQFEQDLVTHGATTATNISSGDFSEVSAGADGGIGAVSDKAVWQVTGEFGDDPSSATDVSEWMTDAISDGDLTAGSDEALFAFNDGSDTYLWHLEAADGTATNIGEGDLELIGQFNEKQEFSHDDFAVA